MRVFLSSTYEDLIGYRAKAAEAIERLGQQGVRMEVFGARPSSAVSASFGEIDSSDAFIGIYGHRYGYTPPGSMVSITEQEFDYACDKKKPMFAFLLDENYPWLPAFIDQEPGYSRLVKFKKKINETVVRDIFNTPDDLAYRVASSLGHFLMEKSVKDNLNQIPQENSLRASEHARDQVARRAAMLHTIISGAQILLVNDVPSEMSRVLSLLRSLGIDVAVATTSDEGLRKLSQQHFDVVISDMTRNGVSDAGTSFLREMRDRALTHPVIFTVGRLNPEMGTPANAFGITNRVDEFLNLVFDALERIRG